MLTSRCEKHKGVTLIVNPVAEWVNVVLDATGHSFEGPVKDDADVIRIASIVIPVLQQIASA